jgi:hypothetical protein
MKFTQSEQDVITAILTSDGYALIERQRAEDLNLAQLALQRKATNWEDTNYYRGKIAALESFQPEAFAKRIREARGGSDA